MSWKLLLLVFLAAAAGLAAAILYGEVRWRARTRAIEAQINAARRTPPVTVYREEELDGLPEPVQRYFRGVLRNGQPVITAARWSQEGEFRRNEQAEDWARFTAGQVVTVAPPAFDWNARIRWAPGLDVLVHDAYVGGGGRLQAAAYGLVHMADEQGTAELAEGQLMRYLAEAPWFPTALLPSQGVRWQAAGPAAALATLNDGPLTVTLEFGFGPEGFIEQVRSEGRWRQAGETWVRMPWEGRFLRYEERSGMKVPVEGEVAWILPSGRAPYWRGQLTGIRYEFAGD